MLIERRIYFARYLLLLILLRIRAGSGRSASAARSAGTTGTIRGGRPTARGSDVRATAGTGRTEGICVSAARTHPGAASAAGIRRVSAGT